MKICFPAQKNEGTASAVYNHFGSAPVFVVVDTATGEVSAIENRDQHHTHGSCNPLKALNSQPIDAVVVGGIGQGALNKLSGLGIKVYRAAGGTIKENLDSYLSSTLSEYTPQACCGGHGHGSGCAH